LVDAGADHCHVHFFKKKSQASHVSLQSTSKNFPSFFVSFFPVRYSMVVYEEGVDIQQYDQFLYLKGICAT
jgi:hypothetical protein